jgi:hypothetical protein
LFACHQKPLAWFASPCPWVLQPLGLHPGKVIGIDACVVDVIKADNHWVFDATLVYTRDSANILKPKRFFSEYPNFRTTLNHKSFSLAL